MEDTATEGVLEGARRKHKASVTCKRGYRLRNSTYLAILGGKTRREMSACRIQLNGTTPKHEKKHTQEGRNIRHGDGSSSGERGERGRSEPTLEQNKQRNSTRK